MRELRSSSKRKRANGRKPRPTVPAADLQQASFNEHPERLYQVSDEDLDRPLWRVEPHLWTDIFQLAAFSLDLEDKKIAAWLASTTRICKRLHPWAVRALLKQPLLSSAASLDLLASYFKNNKTPRFDNVGLSSLVQGVRLEISVAPGSSALRLLTQTPQIRHLTFYSLLDEIKASQPQYRWRYSQIIDIVDDQVCFKPEVADDTAESSAVLKRIRLHSWNWNAKMIDRAWDISILRKFHATPTFAGLQSLSFLYFRPPSFVGRMGHVSSEDDKSYIENFAGSLDVLPNLRALTFQNSPIVSGPLLSNLPRNLETLEIIDCSELESENLGDFLHTHGKSLRRLTLLHNRSLDLGFLVELGSSCPQLQELHMNFTFSRDFQNGYSTRPDFTEVLAPSQIPMWPSTLVFLNLDHIRAWSQETAEMFFQSLIDSAPNLPLLRRIHIRAVLSIPWRTRAKFRSVWHSKLQTVFLRPFEHPKSHGTIRPHTPNIPSLDSSIESDMPRKRRKRARTTQPATRQSRRIADLTPRRSRRSSAESKELRNMNRSSYKEPDTDSDEFDSDCESPQSPPVEREEESAKAKEDDTTSASEAPGFVQGLCEQVDIIFDNNHPTETQFTMGDFVDSQASSEVDSEWDGEDNFDFSDHWE